MGPVTGPFITDVWSGPHYLHKSSYRQKPPFNIKLAYLVSKGYARFSFPPPEQGYPWSTAQYALEKAGDSALYAQAYSRVVGKLGENAGVGISLTQWKQADTMIRNRANTLTRFTEAVFRRSPIGISRALGISVKKAQIALHPKYRGAKGLSNLWLEFWFGWKPLVSDIYAACEVFNNFIPWAHLEGSSKRSVRKNLNEGQFSASHESSGMAFCKVGISVRLVNSNVRLLQQFGLLNAGQVAWDAVPWSFVVDWFINVNQWLGSFTDFAGFETSDGYVTRYCYLKGRTWWPDYPGYGGPVSGVYMSRQIVSSLPRPSLHFKSWSLAPSRALTAITLLVQKLPSR